MKIITHRGWSKGEKENTFEAFEKSIKAKVAGIEFDIHLSSNGQNIHIAHDAPENRDAPRLQDVLSLFKEHPLELFIEVKKYSPTILFKTIRLIEESGATNQTTIFGFESVMKNILPKAHRVIRYGIIAEYPWDIARIIQAYKPNSVLLGWDEDRAWTRFAFRIYWSLFSLPRIFRRYLDVTFLIGVANKKYDIAWLNKQKGLYGITTDNADIAKEVLAKK